MSDTPSSTPDPTPPIVATPRAEHSGALRIASSDKSELRTRTMAAVHHGHNIHGPQSKRELAVLSLGALGVVYGDIGTSPLYAMKECLASAHGVHIPDNVLGNPAAMAAFAPTWVASVMGVLSLMIWAMFLVVIVKYLTFVMRADNKGEGGILALAALVKSKLPAGSKGRLAVPILLALFGAGLLYGDGVITPAISVLGAVEGLSEKSPALSHLVVPITLAILVGLFLVQRHGTHRIGAVFGWVMLIWFFSIGALAVPFIAQTPAVLQAINPLYAIKFLLHGGVHGFLLLGLVVLCVTGGEALYADMGHFGRRPIRIAWYGIALPGLLLNYFGQGALFLSKQPGVVKNPFYELVPSSFLVPMIILATCAAIIASQALISGAFSLTNQAVQLGYAPRVTVKHTSSKSEGQIYIPEVNYLLMVACLILVVGFGSSSKLASAYGIAVTGTMAITSYLYFLVCRHNWQYSLTKSLLLFIPFLLIDLAFFSANAVKFFEGGWIPLAIGTAVFAVMTTWWRGRMELSQVMDSGAVPDQLFLADIAATRLPRVPGTAVFMASGADGIPNVLLHHVKHNKVLHKQVILLSIQTENVPFVAGNNSLTLTEITVPNDDGTPGPAMGFYRLVAKVGFMQRPNVPRILARCERINLRIEEADTTYYLGRQTLLTSGRAGMAVWRKMLFSFLSRNSRPPTDFFQLPPNRVVELGLQIEL